MCRAVVRVWEFPLPCKSMKVGLPTFRIRFPDTCASNCGKSNVIALLDVGSWSSSDEVKIQAAATLGSILDAVRGMCSNQRDTEVYTMQVARRLIAVGISLGLLSCSGSQPTEPQVEASGAEQPSQAQPETTESRTVTPFQSERVEGLGEPEIMVVNTTGHTITIVMTGPSDERLILPPNATQYARLRVGAYAFEASAPGLGNATGTNSFEPDHRYSWTFVVR